MYIDSETKKSLMNDDEPMLVRSYYQIKGHEAKFSKWKKSETLKTGMITRLNSDGTVNIKFIDFDDHPQGLVQTNTPIDWIQPLGEQLKWIVPKHGPASEADRIQLATKNSLLQVVDEADNKERLSLKQRIRQDREDRKFLEQMEKATQESRAQEEAAALLNPEPWTCPTCTFYNEYGSICNMCDATKPQKPVENEDEKSANVTIGGMNPGQQDGAPDPQGPGLGDEKESDKTEGPADADKAEGPADADKAEAVPADDAWGKAPPGDHADEAAPAVPRPKQQKPDDIMAPQNKKDAAPAAPTSVPSAPPQPESAETDCVVCMERKHEFAIVPCGHMCLCRVCGPPESEVESNLKECPICRGDVKGTMQIYGRRRLTSAERILTMPR